MKLYLLSLGAGILVGLIYGVLNVKSPAPPVVALVGLLGMLGGEQVGKHWGEWRAWVGLAAPSRAEGDQPVSAKSSAEIRKDVIDG